MTDTPHVPISWGELLDKITILELKRDRIRDAAALRNVACELALLDAIAAPVVGAVTTLVERLREVNAMLWEIEDAIREEDAAGRFGADFVALARAVYSRNDERAAIKRAINDALGSALVEEKSYGVRASQDASAA